MSSRDEFRRESPPDTPTGAAHAARTLNVLGFTLAPLLIAPLVHNWMDGRAPASGLIAVHELVILATLLLNRAGRTALAAWLFISGTWMLVIGLAFLGGEGSHDIALLALPPVLLISGVLVGRRLLWPLTGLSLLALGALWTGEMQGWIINTFSAETHINTLIDAAVILIMTAAATALLTGDFRRTVVRERSNAEALADSQGKLEEHAAALERSELRFRTAIELAADGILLADAHAQVTEANSRACGFLDLTRAEILGRFLFDLLPPGPNETERLFREALDRGEIVTVERILSRGDRGDLIVETAWQRLPDRTMQCFVRDITVRRRLEDQLRHAQKMEAVGALAGGIAHDFNNLLTVMQGFLELIEADPSLTPEMAANLAELRSVSTHAADLTQQLLAFAGRRPLQRRSADLRDILAGNQRLIARLVGDSIEVAVNPVSMTCPVFVDPSMIAQILLNLAANARDAMPSGGRFTLAAIPPATRTPPRLGLEGFVVRDYTGFLASDTGTGMEAETARRVFEPFFTTKETGKGTGLGLAMVHGIVERHGGWVEVESAPGQGSTFLIYLPVHEPPDLPAGKSVTPAVAESSAGTILLVDDDPGVRRLTQQVLLPLGFAVIEAGSGTEALTAWESHGKSIDMIFTDMVMPGGMNGLQLIKEGRHRQPGVPAILTSGYALPSIEDSPDYSPDITFLSKPYANHVVIETVRSVLAARRDVRNTPRPA